MKPPPPSPGPPPPPRAPRPPGPPKPPAVPHPKTPAPEDFVRKVERIFIAALEKSREEKAAYVAEACAGDDAARAEVEELLRADDALPEFQKGAGERFIPEQAGGMIGNYKLLQELGEGGFGTVWVAEQSEPVRRRVALKIIKVGMDTKEFVARFEQERQALALMDHPNIAKILDGGATPYGRPFFVMELIRGITITEYCDKAGLGMRERLELFIQVCRAVQHAHQKGIIHRDIKPANILVTINDGQAVPKVIDFGIAKAMQGRLTDKTIFTMFEQMIGTPLYMSPEQAEMTSLDIDTRSDIYSLGVVLYELLTGRTPIEAASIAEAGIEKIREIIRDVDPPRPSAKVKTLNGVDLTTAAKRRHVEPTKFSSAIRGDLDWIVMKCIEKDRRRRYDAADGLVLDIERHLTNQTVIARPPTTSYLVGRFVRRNRLLVGAGGAVAVALILGAVVSRWQALRAVAERDAKEQALQVARAAEADTKAFSDFLVKRVLATARPQDVEGGLGIDVSVVRALEQAQKRLEQDFGNRPKAEAVAREAIGVTWETLGRYDEAAIQLEKALKLREQEPHPVESDILKTSNDLAIAYQKAGMSEKSLPLYERVLSKRKETLPPDHPDILLSMNNLAGAYYDTGDLPRSLALYEQTFEASKATLGPDDANTLKSMGNLARAWKEGGNTGKTFPLKAQPLYERALEKSVAELGADHPDTLTSMNNLAVCYEQSGNAHAALPLYERALALSRTKLGDDHPDTLTSMNNLAGAYFKTDHVPKAIQLYEQAVEKGRIKPGADHRDTINSIVNLAVAYEKANEFPKAVELYAEALEKKKARLGPGHRDTLKAMSTLAVAYSEAGEMQKALPFFEQALLGRKSLLGPDAPETLKSMFNMAHAYRAVKDFRNALIHFEELLAAQRRRLGQNDPQVTELERQVAELRILLKEEKQ